LDLVVLLALVVQQDLTLLGHQANLGDLCLHLGQMDLGDLQAHDLLVYLLDR